MQTAVLLISVMTSS